MTVDEALDVLSRLGPADGDWKAFRHAQSAARLCISTASSGALGPRLERLSDALYATHDVYDQAALATGLARTTLELARVEHFAASAAKASFRRPWLEGLLALAKEGLDVWPLVEALAREQTITSGDLAMHVGDVLVLQPDSKLERFTRLTALAPTVALKVAAEFTTWKRLPLGPLTEPVLRLAEDARSPHRAEAVEVLQHDSGTLEPAQLTRVAALIGPDTTELTLALVEVTVRQLVRLGRRSECDAWLDDGRDAVRRAAFHALVAPGALPASEFSRLVRGLVDDDAALSQRADLALRQHLTERGAAPSLEEVALLLTHASDPRVMALVTWVCTQHPALRPLVLARVPAGALHDSLAATATRACASCGPLGRASSWPGANFQPPEFAKLELVVVLDDTDTDTAVLRRCRDCQAHYLFHGHVEYDVNSKHESYSLSRLRLEELRTHYAQHVDFTHPRIATWNEALLADSKHVDPAVRAEAEWELAQRD